MKKYIISFAGLLFICFMAGNVNAQGTPSSDDVVELGVTEIKVKIETPQVRLFSDRIKPEFDDVHLQKSFIKEITGEGERFVFESITDKDAVRIDIDKMANKTR
jgi:hypothetical protein